MAGHFFLGCGDIAMEYEFADAVVLGILPRIAHWGAGLVKSTVAAAVLLIERRLVAEAAFTGLVAVLTFFGLVHSPELTVNASPTLAVAYLLVSEVFLLSSRVAETLPTESDDAQQRTGADLLPENALPENALPKKTLSGKSSPERSLSGESA